MSAAESRDAALMDISQRVDGYWSDCTNTHVIGGVEPTAEQRRYAKALPLALDYALPMLRAVRSRTPRLQRMTGRGPRLVNADVRALPLAANSLGLVWSNLMLHWLDDPLPARSTSQHDTPSR